MDHNSQVRIVDDAKTAVLFIHGIVGTPRHFSHVLPMVQCVADHVSYYNLRLPGHGGTVRDFSSSSMQQWKQEVWRVFRQLADTHEKVAIVGHSMGTLFALQLAAEHPNQVAFLFLIDSPIRPWVSFRGVLCCLRACFGCSRPDHPSELAILRAGGTVLTKKLWRYIPWASHMVSLLLEARRTERLLNKLQSKTIVFQSKQDEMVSLRSGKILEQLPCVSLTILSGSTHVYYPPEDMKLVCTAFTKALTELLG